MAATLRTKEGETRYHAYLKHLQEKGDDQCVLCPKIPLHSFQFYKIVQNDFPYDRLAETHHMLIPLRHSAESELLKEEKIELQHIKEDYLDENYHYIIEATNRNKSVPGHFHLHLIVMKDVF
ncbi:MAG: hypothetical protein G01um101466_651 [Parcubacteria group bacterium Gr01-1014_66]|nr:MAG: hypothetical protein G01um101466_651 [Parcubacteria group bacterium Gr01-1014_66]